MFDKKYEQRLSCWSNFREKLESSDTPIQDTLEFYNKAPTVSIHTDPWDNQTWPTPWELVKENQYCDFCRVLGLCYSLQLTERFSRSKFEIHIVIDNKNSATHYLLYLDDLVVNHANGEQFHANKLPTFYETKKIYSMDALQ
jgi:hypothetical protein